MSPLEHSTPTTIDRLPIRAPGRDGQKISERDWRNRYRTKLAFVDAFVIIWAVLGAYMVRFHLFTLVSNEEQPYSYVVLSLCLAAGWWLMLQGFGTRDPRVLGSGPDEYRGVTTASLSLFGLVAILSYMFRYDTARGYVALALPAGLIGLLFARYVIRQLIRLERERGDSSARVIVIGGPEAAEHLVSSLLRQPQAGYKPIGAYLVGADDRPGHEISVPIVGTQTSIDTIMQTIEKLGADTVAISAGAQISPVELRRLGWRLAERGTRMILAPALTDVAGPRLHTQPVAGLPLVHVSTPKLTGGKRLAKRVFDLVGSGALILVLSPLLVVIALLVRVSSPGPIFYRQDRIGINGKTFRMTKFRSMRLNADDELASLLATQGSGEKPLFKVANDPRVTPVGRVLRKYSLDELPQLFNVFSGSMSLVGPRPQREGEVALYDDAAHRRLYVSPGMSGLWQVSGRSNLSWEESIQLDLYYVENWSLTQDIIILMKTFKAVFVGDGAI